MKMELKKGVQIKSLILFHMLNFIQVILSDDIQTPKMYLNFFKCEKMLLYWNKSK